MFQLCNGTARFFGLGMIDLLLLIYMECIAANTRSTVRDDASRTPMHMNYLNGTRPVTYSVAALNHVLRDFHHSYTFTIEN